jgi:hypothetical protein
MVLTDVIDVRHQGSGASGYIRSRGCLMCRGSNKCNARSMMRPLWGAFVAVKGLCGSQRHQSCRQDISHLALKFGEFSSLHVEYACFCNYCRVGGLARLAEAVQLSCHLTKPCGTAAFEISSWLWYMPC